MQAVDHSVVIFNLCCTGREVASFCFKCTVRLVCPVSEALPIVYSNWVDFKSLR